MAAKGMRKIKLKEVCDRITVGHVGPMAEKYTAEGVPFLRSQNIAAFRLNLDDIKFIPPDFHEKLRKSKTTRLEVPESKLKAIVDNAVKQAAEDKRLGENEQEALRERLRRLLRLPKSRRL